MDPSQRRLARPPALGACSSFGDAGDSVSPLSAQRGQARVIPVMAAPTARIGSQRRPRGRRSNDPDTIAWESQSESPYGGIDDTEPEQPSSQVATTNLSYATTSLAPASRSPAARLEGVAEAPVVQSCAIPPQDCIEHEGDPPGLEEDLESDAASGRSVLRAVVVKNMIDVLPAPSADPSHFYQGVLVSRTDSSGESGAIPASVSAVAQLPSPSVVPRASQSNVSQARAPPTSQARAPPTSQARAPPTSQARAPPTSQARAPPASEDSSKPPARNSLPYLKDPSPERGSDPALTPAPPTPASSQVTSAHRDRSPTSTLHGALAPLGTPRYFDGSIDRFPNLDATHIPASVGYPSLLKVTLRGHHGATWRQHVVLPDGVPDCGSATQPRGQGPPVSQQASPSGSSPGGSSPGGSSPLRRLVLPAKLSETPPRSPSSPSLGVPPAHGAVNTNTYSVCQQPSTPGGQSPTPPNRVVHPPSPLTIPIPQLPPLTLLPSITTESLSPSIHPATFSPGPSSYTASPDTQTPSSSRPLLHPRPPYASAPTPSPSSSSSSFAPTGSSSRRIGDRSEWVATPVEAQCSEYLDQIERGELSREDGLASINYALSTSNNGKRSSTSVQEVLGFYRGALGDDTTTSQLNHPSFTNVTLDTSREPSPDATTQPSHTHPPTPIDARSRPHSIDAESIKENFAIIRDQYGRTVAGKLGPCRSALRRRVLRRGCAGDGDDKLVTRYAIVCVEGDHYPGGKKVCSFVEHYFKNETQLEGSNVEEVEEQAAARQQHEVAQVLSALDVLEGAMRGRMAQLEAMEEMWHRRMALLEETETMWHRRLALLERAEASTSTIHTSVSGPGGEVGQESHGSGDGEIGVAGASDAAVRETEQGTVGESAYDLAAQVNQTPQGAAGDGVEEEEAKA